MNYQRHSIATASENEHPGESQFNHSSDSQLGFARTLPMRVGGLFGSVTSPTVREGQSIGPVERSNIARGENFELEHPSQALSSSPGHHRRQRQDASTEPEQPKIQETGQRFQGGKRGVADRRSKASRRGAIDIPDSSAVHQPSDAAYDQRLVLRGCDFPTGIGRSVRQRLELGEGGTLVLEQSVVELPSSSLPEMVPVRQSNRSQARETAIRELQAPKKKTIKRGSGVINQNTARTA